MDTPVSGNDPDTVDRDRGAAESGRERAKLGPVGATIIVTGNMLGSGIYLLPATLGTVGSISLVGWGIALVAALVLSLTCAMLAIRRPAQPGVVGYVAGVLGGRIGFQVGYVYWIAVMLGNSAVALAAASYMAQLAPVAMGSNAVAWVAIALICTCTVANIGGARLIAGVGGLSLAIGLAPVLVMAVPGYFWFDPQLFRESWNVTGQSAVSAVTMSLPSIAWAFLGLESAGVAALVVRDPQRNVPLATIGGVLIAGIIYVLMSAAMFGLAPAAELAGSAAPIADVAGRLWGPWVALAMAGCAAVKATGTLAGWTLVGAETAVSAAKIGLLPSAGRGPRGSLIAYLVIGGAIMIGTTLFSRSSSIGMQFGLLINSTTLLCLLVYACCGAALFRIRGEFAAGRERHLATAVGVMSIAICFALMLICGAMLLAFATGVVVSGVALAVVLHAIRSP